MYKKAIGQGTPMKYNTFLNVVNKHLPQPNSYEFEDVSAPYVEDPQYTYYFYPLQSFRHQLNNFHPTRGGVSFNFAKKALNCNFFENCLY